MAKKKKTEKKEEQLSLTEDSIKNAVASLREKNYKLFIASPMYGGMGHGLFLMSCLGIQTVMNSHGVETKFSFLFNESLITRARNHLVDEFLRSGCTHLLFLDADIQVNPFDVTVLMALEKDLIGGPYPKKGINWDAVACAARKNPEMPPQELENLVGNFVFNIDKDSDVGKGKKKLLIYEPTEVMEIGTGFMMIKREVFEKMNESSSNMRYKPDHLDKKDLKGREYVTAYFDTVIDKKESITGGGTERYLSEDYMFCGMWRKLGGKVILCPWMKTKHVGTYPFIGDLAAVAMATEGTITKSGSSK